MRNNTIVGDVEKDPTSHDPRDKDFTLVREKRWGQVYAELSKNGD